MLNPTHAPTLKFSILIFSGIPVWIVVITLYIWDFLREETRYRRFNKIIKYVRCCEKHSMVTFSMTLKVMLRPIFFIIETHNFNLGKRGKNNVDHARQALQGHFGIHFIAVCHQPYWVWTSFDANSNPIEKNRKTFLRKS